MSEGNNCIAQPKLEVLLPLVSLLKVMILGVMVL